MLRTGDLIGFVCWLAVANAGVAVGRYHNDANPGKCTLADYNLILQPLETVPWPAMCDTITCESAEGIARFTGCGSYPPREGFRKEGSLYPNAAYPQCCEPKYVPI